MRSVDSMASCDGAGGRSLRPTAISVPCGFAPADDDEGARLPLGLQLIGKPWDEAGVLSVAEIYERASGWVSEQPGARA